MTNEQRKEELHKKFILFAESNKVSVEKWEEVDGRAVIRNGDDFVFDWFYSEIESRDKEIDALNDDVRGYRNGHELNSKRYIEALSKLQRLEEIIKAADKVIKNAPNDETDKEAYPFEAYWKALEHYNKLKSKLPSGI